MQIRTCVTASVALLTFLSPVRAQAPDKIEPTRIVGTVLGKPVTAADIDLTKPIDTGVKFDASDAGRWGQMSKIAKKFGAPILDRFIVEKKVVASDEEVKACKRSMESQDLEKVTHDLERGLADTRRSLNVPGLSGQDRAKLEEHRATIEKRLQDNRRRLAVQGDMARSFVVSWKTERELQHAYGGRVIFQQFGSEALDARRKLFEEAEKKGDLKFDEPGVRHLFYYYANMDHRVIDAAALEKPWFLDENSPSPK